MADDDLQLSAAQKQDLMGKLMRDLNRAAALGLLPQDGARISARGEFIIEPTNIEAEENKKMRGYRQQEFPKALHGWGVDPNAPEAGEGPLELVVKNRAEEANALAVGWSLEPVVGPAGRLGVPKSADPEPEPEVIRTFAAPGQFQPQDTTKDPVITSTAAPKKRGRKPKQVQ